MGSSQSSTVKKTIETINENMVDILQKNNVTSHLESNVQQVLNINISGTNIQCDTFEISNEGQIVADMTSTFTSTADINIASQLQQAIQDAVDSNQEQVKGFLSTAIAESQSQNTDLATKLKTFVGANVKSINESICSNYARLTQNANIDLSGVTIQGKMCNFKNKAQVLAVSTCVTNTVLNLIKQDEQMLDFVSRVEIAQKQKGGGVEDVVSSIFSGISGIIIASIIGFLVLVIIVAIFYKFLGGKDQDAIREAALRNLNQEQYGN